jgi:hypothetical protein
VLFGNERPHKMQNTEDQIKILKLASQVLDETIDRENFIKLEELLSVSSENRNFYLEVIRLEALLHWEQEADEEEITFEKPKIIPFPFYTTALSAAAVFVALIAGWWAFSNFESGTTTNTPTEVAHYISPELDELQSGNQIPSEKLASADHARTHPPGPVYTPMPEPEKVLIKEFRKGVELLEREESSYQYGSLDTVGPVRRLSRIGQLSRPTERGVLPAVGNDMIALSELQIDVDSQSAELMEMIQILDLRDIATNIATGEVQLNAEAMINQSYGACQEGAEFAVSFHAFRGRELSQQDEIGSWESSLKCDIDPQTWESLISSVQLPMGTEFVVVSINVRKSGSDAFVANTSSYYSDDFRLSLQEGEKMLVRTF